MPEINIGGTPLCTKPSDSLDLAYLEPSDTYKCHICNVNVPAMCYQKHKKSEQHETMKKIHKQMNTIHNKQDIGKDVYYCAPCSKIIKIENKQKHEDGDYHAKSVKDLIITNEFYKILKERESNDKGEVNKTILCEVNKAAFGEVRGLQTDRLKANDSYGINHLNLEVNSNLLDSDDEYKKFLDDIDPEQKEKFEIIIEELKERKKKSFEEYLKQMRKKFNLNVKLPVVSGEFISIEAPNGDTVQVSRQHFHSYREVKDNIIYCQLCKKSVSKDTRLHDVSEDHVRNIFRPFNDKFARWVDTISSHCILCNEIVLTKSDHITLNDGHKKIIKDTKTRKKGKTFCKECKLFVHTYDFSVHLNSKKHLSRFKQNHLLKKPNDSTVSNNGSYDSTIISNSNNASTEINNQNNAPTEINNQNNAPIEINDQNHETTSTNNESYVVDIKVNDSMLCCENQNDIKPTENKEGGSSTVTTYSIVSDHGDEIIDQNTNPESGTVTTYSIVSDHDDEKFERNTSPGSETVTNCCIVSDHEDEKIEQNTSPGSGTVTNYCIFADHEDEKIERNTSPGSKTVTNCCIVSDHEDEKIEQNTSPGSGTGTAYCIVSDHEDEKIEQNTSPGSGTGTTYCIVSDHEDEKIEQNAGPGSGTGTNYCIVSDHEDEKIEQNTSPGSSTVTTCSIVSDHDDETIEPNTSPSETVTTYSIVSDHKDEIIAAYSDLMEFVDDARTKVKCKICSVNISFAHRNIIEHLEGRNHKTKAWAFVLKQKNEQNASPGSGTGTNYCIVSDHEDEKIEQNTSPGSSAATTTITTCSIVSDHDDETIEPNTSPSETVTTYSIVSDHKDEIIAAYSDLMEFVDEARTIVRCKICYVNISFANRNIIEHLEGRNHKTKAHKQKNENYFKLLFYVDDEKTKVKCKICDVHVPYEKKNIIEHMEGRNHKNVENELLKFHSITRESSEFICDCCDIRVTYYLDHINSKTHTLKYLEEYEIDKNEMQKYVYDDNVSNAVARRHRERYTNLLKHNGIFKIDDTNYYCGMCKISLGRISEIYHVLGKRHGSKIEKVTVN